MPTKFLGRLLPLLPAARPRSGFPEPIIKRSRFTGNRTPPATLSVTWKVSPGAEVKLRIVTQL